MKNIKKSKIDFGFLIYLLFMSSYFLRFPARISILGSMHFDVLIAGIAIVLAFTMRSDKNEFQTADRISPILAILIFYIIFSLPLVKWPGSVLQNNFENFIRGVVFFYFTKSFVRTEWQLKSFIIIFIFAQTFRVLEPLWLHATQGYWGDVTFVGTGFTNRLACAPQDTCNPNGLAFVVAFATPLLYFMTKESLVWGKLLFYICMPLFIYALILTQSRSGLIAFGIVFAGIIVTSKNKIIWSIVVLFVTIVVFINLGSVYKDRFASINIFDKDNVSHSSAQGRIDAWITDINIALERPLFGYGLGTSGEARWNISRSPQLSHNLYLEVLIELGLIGLVIYLIFLKNLLAVFLRVRKSLETLSGESVFLYNLSTSLLILLVMLFVYSLASFGLSGPYFYLMAGLAVVTLRLVEEEKATRLSF